MSGYDKTEAYLCACKGEPYSLVEWKQEVARLEDALRDARECLQVARMTGGYALPRGLLPDSIQSVTASSYTGADGAKRLVGPSAFPRCGRDPEAQDGS